MSQKCVCNEFNDSDCDENLWEMQRDYDTKSENSVDNDYDEFCQISFEICILESLLWYLKFIDQSLEINACCFIQII